MSSIQWDIIQRRMEQLRTDNELLRESGIYWYNIRKDLLQRYKGLNICMWKVILIICTLGNPCVIMEEDPIKTYKSKDDCLAVAQEKEADIINTFSQYGYAVTDNEQTVKLTPTAYKKPVK